MNTALATDLLFRPLRIGKLDLPNRIVMAPMTRSFAPNGVLDPAMAAYYAARAAGGAGLIISEGTAVPHEVAHFTNMIPHFYGDAALAQWRAVLEAVHQAGGRMFPQLWHTGLGRMADHTANPAVPSIGPSALGSKPARAMQQHDIDAVIDAFAAGAATAEAMGFDGVAIHGAHGYLLDAFFWARSNRRDDRYGGEPANRVRFAVEVVREMRRRVAPDFPIMFRFSQWKGTDYNAKIADTPDELAAFLQPLAAAGVDVFDASARRFWLPEFPGSSLNLAGWAQKLTGKPAMAVGSVGLESPLDVTGRLETQNAAAVSTANLALLLDMMARDEFDLVGVGRVLLANPTWPRLVRAHRFSELKPYNPARVGAFIEPAG